MKLGITRQHLIMVCLTVIVVCGIVFADARRELAKAQQRNIELQGRIANDDHRLAKQSRDLGGTDRVVAESGIPIQSEKSPGMLPVIPYSTVAEKRSEFIGKSGREYPECVPGSDSPEAYHELGSTVNGIPYMCSEQGKWEEDRVTEKAESERARHVEDLYFALRTRVLTPSEEKEAHELGDDLHKPCGTSLGWCTWMPQDEVTYASELNDAWYQQRRLQQLAKDASPFTAKKGAK